MYLYSKQDFKTLLRARRFGPDVMCVYSRKKNAGYLKAAWLIKEHLSYMKGSLCVLIIWLLLMVEWIKSGAGNRLDRL